MNRCAWVKLDNPLYVDYHDDEWGRASHDDRHLFEMLILEGAQAGLSWETILNKRAAYRKAYKGFEPRKVARLDWRPLMKDAGLVRNRLKLQSSVSNAAAFLAVQKEFGSFDAYLWRFVDGKPLKGDGTLVARTPVSDALSKDLLQRGFRFVGSTIMYAYMQAVGMVNDHALDCDFRRSKKKEDPGCPRSSRSSKAASQS